MLPALKFSLDSFQLRDHPLLSRDPPDGERRLSDAQVWAQEEAAKQRSRELIYRAQYLQWLSDTAARDARYYSSREAAVTRVFKSVGRREAPDPNGPPPCRPSPVSIGCQADHEIHNPPA
jgi:hypothetical protein